MTVDESEAPGNQESLGHVGNLSFVEALIPRRAPSDGLEVRASLKAENEGIVLDLQIGRPTSARA
jgi:hypothetical protein